MLLTRTSTSADQDALLGLYPTVFPDEDLTEVVSGLLRENVGVISLIAEKEGRLVGHVMFTHCGVGRFAQTVALLGPLAVAPNVQKQGIGTRLVEDGFKILRDQKIATVCVLGDPGYYGRFGFAQEDHIQTPFPIPSEWQAGWQSLSLQGETGTELTGKLEVPTPWQVEALWAP